MLIPRLPDLLHSGGDSADAFWTCSSSQNPYFSPPNVVPVHAGTRVNKHNSLATRSHAWKRHQGGRRRVVRGFASVGMVVAFAGGSGRTGRARARERARAMRHRGGLSGRQCDPHGCGALACSLPRTILFCLAASGVMLCPYPIDRNDGRPCLACTP